MFLCFPFLSIDIDRYLILSFSRFQLSYLSPRNRSFISSLSSSSSSSSSFHSQQLPSACDHSTHVNSNHLEVVVLLHPIPILIAYGVSYPNTIPSHSVPPRGNHYQNAFIIVPSSRMIRPLENHPRHVRCMTIRPRGLWRVSCMA